MKKMLCPPVLSYYILTCHTVSCRMISDPIVSNRILLYPVVSYRIVSYIILVSLVLSPSTSDQRSTGCASSSMCGSSSTVPRSVGSSRVTLPSASRRRRTSTRGSATGWPELSLVRVENLWQEKTLSPVVRNAEHFKSALRCKIMGGHGVCPMGLCKMKTI